MKIYWEVWEYVHAQDRGHVIARFVKEIFAEAFKEKAEELWYDKGYQYTIKKISRSYL